MWNPDTYMKFSGLRTRPALELASRCRPVSDGLIYDLGCGPGNSTQVLASLFPEARITGIDSSREMLDRAAIEGPAGVSWQQGDLGDWSAPEAADLIFSNAVYNWLGDHQTLFPRLLAQLKQSQKGGAQLAIQMPQNWAAPSHTLMKQAAEEGPFKGKTSGVLQHDIVRSPQEYYDIFAPLTADIDI